jgi:hypothetical protein
MLEYYIRNSKNVRKDVLALMNELTNYFSIEGIGIEKINTYSNLELKNILSHNDYKTICGVLSTVEKNKNKYPFLKKFIKKEIKHDFKSNKFADLFAGCGGLSLGLENAGFKPVFVNEIDPTFAETQNQFLSHYKNKT